MEQVSLVRSDCIFQSVGEAQRKSGRHTDLGLSSTGKGWQVLRHEIERWSDLEFHISLAAHSRLFSSRHHGSTSSPRTRAIRLAKM